MLIGVIGKKRVGKDTFVDYCLTRLPCSRKVAIADSLKTLCMDTIGLSHEQVYGESKDTVIEGLTVSPRQILQNVGTLVRMFNSDYFIQQLTIPSVNIVFISDVRLKNEYDYFSKKGAVFVRITKDTNEVDTHYTEHEMNDVKTEWTIHNNGTLNDFYRKIDEFLVTIQPVGC